MTSLSNRYDWMTINSLLITGPTVSRDQLIADLAAETTESGWACEGDLAVIRDRGLCVQAKAMGLNIQVEVDEDGEAYDVVESAAMKEALEQLTKWNWLTVPEAEGRGRYLIEDCNVESITDALTHTIIGLVTDEQSPILDLLITSKAYPELTFNMTFESLSDECGDFEAPTGSYLIKDGQLLNCVSSWCILSMREDELVRNGIMGWSEPDFLTRYPDFNFHEHCAWYGLLTSQTTRLISEFEFEQAQPNYIPDSERPLA